MPVRIISRIRPGDHAGTKAPLDARSISETLGIASIDLDSHSQTGSGRFSVLPEIARMVRTYASAPRGDILIVQYPLGRPADHLLATPTRARTIALVHDLDAHRAGLAVQSDVARLRHFDTVICHTPAMSALLAPLLPRSVAVGVLGMFDYLTSSAQRMPASGSAPQVLHVAGNLDPTKAGYVYDIPDSAVPVHAYGVNCDVARLPAHVQWLGVLDMHAPSVPPPNGFGLVWDGPSSASLQGPNGHYLRVSAPHKFSMYIAAGVPVVVSDESAIASLVIDAGIGYAVPSVRDGLECIENCSVREWDELLTNVAALRGRVVTGEHTKAALTAACDG